MNGYRTRATCRLCGGDRLQEALDLGAMPVGDRYLRPDEDPASTPAFPLTLQVCRGCGHWQLGGVVAPELLYGDYLYETGSSPGLEAHFAGYAREAEAACGLAPGSRVVDLGSNTGVLLSAFQALGHRVLGVEPAAGVAETARRRGVPTRTAWFTRAEAEAIVAEGGPADLVTANNVLANIDDLDAVVHALDPLLARDGAFVVETGYALDTLGQFVIDNVYHEHLSYFAVAPTARFLEARGLRLFRVERVPTKGGSIRLHACRAASNRATHASVTGLSRLEAELGFLDGSAAGAFAARAADLRARLQDLLAGLAKAGPLVGYGASVGASTLLHWLQAGGHFDWLADDNPVKQGRLSPGYRLPVRPPAELLRRRPEVVVNLAWRYLDLIRARNAEFVRGGGRFQQLLPWPWLA